MECNLQRIDHKIIDYDMVLIATVCIGYHMMSEVKALLMQNSFIPV